MGSHRKLDIEKFKLAVVIDPILAAVLIDNAPSPVHVEEGPTGSRPKSLRFLWAGKVEQTTNEKIRKIDGQVKLFEYTGEGGSMVNFGYCGTLMQGASFDDVNIRRRCAHKSADPIFKFTVIKESNLIVGPFIDRLSTNEAAKLHGD